MIKQFVLVLLFYFIIGKNIAQQSTASKQVSTFMIEAPQLQAKKKIWVYLPKNYSTSNKKYSIIYIYIYICMMHKIYLTQKRPLQENGM
jgi:hypothetical protein